MVLLDGIRTVPWRDSLRREAWSSRVLDDAAWLMYPGSLMRFTVEELP